MLAQKIAFITGAGSGIGKATSQLFAREGAIVIATDLNGEAANETVKSLSGKGHLSIALDVSNDDQIVKTIDDLKGKSLLPSVYVNNAGITRDEFLVNLTKKSFQEVLDINLLATFTVTQKACQTLIESKIPGTIVNVSSVVGGQIGNIGQCNYAASKAGVVGFTKSVALEMARYNIRCNAVLPGFTETEMTKQVPEKVINNFLKIIPLRRMAKPEEIAELIAFLASDKSSYITGTAIPITGGLT